MGHSFEDDLISLCIKILYLISYYVIVLAVDYMGKWWVGKFMELLFWYIWCENWVVKICVLNIIRIDSKVGMTGSPLKRHFKWSNYTTICIPTYTLTSDWCNFNTSFMLNFNKIIIVLKVVKIIDYGGATYEMLGCWLEIVNEDNIFLSRLIRGNAAINTIETANNILA